MNRASGQLLLIGILLIVFAYNMSRTFIPQGESPVFLTEGPGMIMVELGSGFHEPAIHQLIDGATLIDVIKLTTAEFSTVDLTEHDLNRTIKSGEKIVIYLKDTTTKEVRVSWMSAAKRVALGIPLHPDRMSLDDWQFLPGIGISMARKIINNRQKIGDFGTFNNLRRVHGIGEKRLNTWNQYFF